MLKRIVSILALSCALFAQTESDPGILTGTKQIQGADTKYSNGVAVPYMVSPASGLNVNVGPGTTQCVDVLADYAGGTLSLTDNATQYVVIDPTADCAPVVIQASAYSQSVWALAKVVTASGAITTLQQLRVGPQISTVNNTSGSGGSSGAGGGANATGNEIISGCGVKYSGAGLVFTVAACDYRIAGTAYHSAENDAVTLAAADPSNPRIDDIIVNTSAVATSVAGTPASVPVAPTLNPSTQLQLTGQGITVGAAATTPSGLSSLSLYDDTASPPWTCAVSSNLNCSSASNTFNSGADDIEATSAVTGNNVTLTKPSGAITLSSYDTLVFYIRSKSTWSNPKTVNMYWTNGSAAPCGAVSPTPVSIRTQLLGFNSAVTGSYQPIIVQLSSFAASTCAVNKFHIDVAGGGGSIGFYVASVSLQSGTGGTSSNSVACSQEPAFTGDVTTPGASCTTTIAAGAVTNTKLQNSSVSVNGTTCTLGSSCAPAGAGAVGTTGSPSAPKIAVFSGAASITNIGTPTNCSAGSYARGIDANGDASNCTVGATGTVTSVATTSPITGGTITGTGTIACAGCVTSSSPGVGIAHFAGSTQAVTSSAVDLSGADATGTIAAARMPALTGDVTTSAGAVATTLGSTFKKRGIGFSYGDPAGSALVTGSTSTSYVTVPFACTISAYNLLVDAGTITVKFWKVATGTAIPTSGNSISTSGVSISSGTAIHSTTVSDFTSTTVTANDIMAMNITAVSTAKYVNAVLECDQ